MARWCAEPIKAVIVPTSIFLCNSNGFPVLSKAHQAVVRKLMQVGWGCLSMPALDAGRLPLLIHASHAPPRGQYKCQFVVSGNPKYSHGARTFSR